MANDVRIIITGDDKFSSVAGKVRQSAGQLETGIGGLGKTVAATAGGFIAAQVGISGLSMGLSKTVGAAAAYEAQFAEIRALTGATKQDTDQLSVAIKGMSSELAKSPAELAAGAYFILSSGISDAADAAEVLEIAAKASAVGLGETAIVADALTTVLNAYGKETSEAGQVTDVLMQAVKDGKAEADAFAGVLGRVVPIASQMGISFEEVAANLATFTRLGVSAEEAATGLRGVMTAMLKPSEEAEVALAGVGLSMAQVRAEVKEKGLAAVLQTLLERFHGNTEEIAKLFPEVRGLTNVLATAGVQGDAYTDILGNMDTATGNLDRGFAEVSATTKFKLDKAINELNLSLMKLGEKSLPIVAKVAAFVTTILEGLEKAERLVTIETDKQTEANKKNAISLSDIGKAVINPFENYKKLAQSLHDTTTASQRLRDEGIDPLSFRTDEAARHIFDLKAGMLDAGDAAKVGLTAGILVAKATIEKLTEKVNIARDALFKMFTEPTQEEQESEAILANYRLELAKLQEQAGDTELAEGSRGQQLRDDLIPTQERHLDVLRLTRDAAKEEADVKLGTFSTQDEWARKIREGTGALEGLQGRIGELQLPIDEQSRRFADQSLKLIDLHGRVTDYDTALRNIPRQISTEMELRIIETKFKQMEQEDDPRLAKKMAHGGIVTSPTVALIGESGPEAVIPLSGSGGSLEGLASAIAKALRGLTVTVDGREIGRLAMAYGGNATDLLRRGG